MSPSRSLTVCEGARLDYGTLVQYAQRLGFEISKPQNRTTSQQTDSFGISLLCFRLLLAWRHREAGRAGSNLGSGTLGKFPAAESRE